jgi:hypothetical protein
MQNRPFTCSPAYISNVAANLINSAQATVTAGVGINAAAGATAAYTQPYVIIKHIHIANNTAGAVTFSLFVGATGGSAAGTELYKDVSIAAKGYFDQYLTLRLDSTQFLTGLASAATSLIFQAEGEVGFS